MSQIAGDSVAGQSMASEATTKVTKALLACGVIAGPLFMVVSVALEFLLGLLFALVLNQRFPGRGLARAAVLVPWAFPTVISAVVWRALLWQNNTGAIPAILHTFGLVPATWAPLASNGTLIAAMIIIDVWKTAPFMALLLLAGLQVISEEVYEAGRVDGANVWQRFFRITLPLLKPAILVALLFRTLDAWRVFDMFFVVAGNRLSSISVYASFPADESSPVASLLKPPATDAPAPLERFATPPLTAV